MRGTDGGGERAREQPGNEDDFCNTPLGRCVELLLRLLESTKGKKIFTKVLEIQFKRLLSQFCKNPPALTLTLQ